MFQYYIRAIVQIQDQTELKETSNQIDDQTKQNQISSSLHNSCNFMASFYW